MPDTPTHILTEEELAAAGELGLQDFSFDVLEQEGLQGELSTITSGAGRETITEIMEDIAPPPPTETEQQRLETRAAFEETEFARRGGATTAIPPVDGETADFVQIERADGTTAFFGNPEGNADAINKILAEGGKIIEMQVRPGVSFGAPEAVEDTEAIAEREIRERFEQNRTELNAVLDPLKAQLEITKQRQIENIQSQFDQLRAKQETANKRRVRLQETIGVRFGGRFVIEHTADLVLDQINIGIQAISRLNSEENAAISDIQSAFDEKSFSLALTRFEALTKIREQRDKELADIEKAQVKALKELQEQERDVSIDLAISSLRDQGVTEAGDILELINVTEQGKVIGDVTLEEIEKRLKILEPDETLAGLSSDFKTYKFLQESEDPAVEGLSYFEFQAAVANAKRKPGEDLTGVSADLRTFAVLRPDLEVGTPEFLAAFNQFQKEGGGARKGTEAEKRIEAVSNFSAAFIPGATLSDGTPIIEVSGFISPKAWKEAIKDAPNEGLTRKEFIQEFGYLINIDKDVVSKYGLTAIELKIITGEL